MAWELLEALAFETLDLVEALLEVLVDTADSRFSAGSQMMGMVSQNKLKKIIKMVAQR